ncbi:rubredoxin [Aeromicrobium sp.]
MSKYICPNCEYVYDEALGDPREGWPPGTPFTDIDPDWCCPDCGVREQQDFNLLDAEGHRSDSDIAAEVARREEYS